MVHYERLAFLDQPAQIGWVAEGSSAAKAGILPGDRIVRIADIQNPTWEDVIPKAGLSPNQPLNVAIQRGDQILNKTVTPTPSGPDQFGSPGWVPYQPVLITEISPDLPAAKSGLKLGDIILFIDGVPMHSVDEVVHHVRDVNPGKPVEVTALRNGKQEKFNVTPVKSQIEGESEPVYRLGFRSAPMKVEKLPFGMALAKSIEQNRKYSLVIVELVEKMVRRQVSIKQMEGPIGIAKASGDAARETGWTPLLLLMAAISLNLGIFNLFPIPILDGGLILLLLIEGTMQRDISLNVKERIYQAAFVFLVLFACVIIYNDIVKQLPGLTTRLP
jgi:regulator of sigma E protease